MACDLAVMVDDAFIRHVGLEHGSVPAGGATQWLQLMVGDRRAREIVLLCDEIPAPKAAEWGLVNRAVPARRARRGRRRLGREPRPQAARRRRATRSSSSTSGATSPGTRPIGHARDWLSLSMLGDEAQGAIPRSSTRGGARTPARSSRTLGVTRMADEVAATRHGRRGAHGRDGAVLTITFNRPEVYNAFNRELHAALARRARRRPPTRRCAAS